MRKTAAIATLALSLISSVAMAQERGGDAALGALSGALVLGPIGAVAGAVVGYAAGPSIAHSWGLRRSGTARQGGKSARREARLSPDRGQPAPNNQAGPPPAAKAPSPSPKTASAGPGPGVRHSCVTSAVVPEAKGGLTTLVDRICRLHSRLGSELFCVGNAGRDTGCARA